MKQFSTTNSEDLTWHTTYPYFSSLPHKYTCIIPHWKTSVNIVRLEAEKLHLQETGQKHENWQALEHASTQIASVIIQIGTFAKSKGKGMRVNQRNYQKSPQPKAAQQAKPKASRQRTKKDITTQT